MTASDIGTEKILKNQAKFSICSKNFFLKKLSLLSKLGSSSSFQEVVAEIDRHNRITSPEAQMPQAPQKSRRQKLMHLTLKRLIWSTGIHELVILIILAVAYAKHLRQVLWNEMKWKNALPQGLGGPVIRTEHYLYAVVIKRELLKVPSNPGYEIKANLHRACLKCFT